MEFSNNCMAVQALLKQKAQNLKNDMLVKNSIQHQEE